MGELNDLVQGWRYREYLESRKRAQFARLLLSAWVKKPPSVDEMTGVWDDGVILDKAEQYRRAKARILNSKKKQPLL